ncbi:MAG: hypothetical protein KKA73_08400 [Chloroflexi bacterium]|nr:hypothetical protein [Chloroflexota bacterium]MBU1747696.1 hypothetical protein [Chloroflexota bacterium]
MGLKLSVKPSAILSTLGLWAILASVAVWLLSLPLAEAVAGSLVAVGLHWLSELVHQLGHAWAARRVGYPMEGIRFWDVLSTSLYPRDEPELPAEVHIRRALGGPAASLMLSLVAALVLVGLWPLGGAPRWVAVFFWAENLLVFTLGAFLPLRFTDGSTLLTWWRKR